MAGERKSPQRRSVAQAKRVSSKQPSPSGGTGRSNQSADAKGYVPHGKRKRQNGYEGRAKARYTGKNAGKQPVSKKTHMRWPQFIFLFVLLAALISAGLFAWNRWFRFDDVQDFQGHWNEAGTTTPVAIDGKLIQLAPEVAYSYTLDTWDKTISYTFGELDGSGKYRFSPDRKKLVIIEDGTDDWILYVKIALGLSEVEEGAEGEGTTVLVKGSATASNLQGGSAGQGGTPDDSQAVSDGTANDGQGALDEAGGGENDAASGTQGASDASGEDQRGDALIGDGAVGDGSEGGTG